MQVFGANLRFFLRFYTKTGHCRETHNEVGGDLTEMPSRSQFLSFLVERVPGGKPRLSGEKGYWSRLLASYPKIGVAITVVPRS